jgi:hypothetical protein
MAVSRKLKAKARQAKRKQALAGVDQCVYDVSTRLEFLFPAGAGLGALVLRASHNQL